MNYFYVVFYDEKLFCVYDSKTKALNVAQNIHKQGTAKVVTVKEYLVDGGTESWSWGVTEED